MGLPDARQSRPAANRTAPESFDGDLPSIAPDTRNLADLDPARTPHAVENPKATAHAWAALVMRRNGHWSRQIYLSLHSATRAMERAEARGVDARLVLVELVPVTAAPVYVVDAGEAS